MANKILNVYVPYLSQIGKSHCKQKNMQENPCVELDWTKTIVEA